MRVKFLVDINKDLEEIKKFDELRKVYFGNPYYFFNYYKNLRNKSTREIISFFNQNKVSIEIKLIKRKRYIESLWKPFNNIFFNEIRKITNFDFKYSLYECHICAVNAGEYVRYSNKITIFAFFNKKDTIETIAEELLHLHFWEILRKLKIDIKDKEDFYWELSECMPPLIFSEINIGIKLFRKYPDWKHVRKLFRNIKPLWENRESFEGFLRKVVETFVEG